MSDTDDIRVVVADDQQIIREGLVALLGLMDGIEVVGAAGDGEDVLRLLAETPADIVLMDLRMPVMDGVKATERITREYPQVAVLVLTTYADDDSIVSALHAGARGYLTKDAGRAEIAAALRATASGQSTFGAVVSRRLVAALRHPDSSRLGPVDRWSNPDRLTPREVEVVKLIAQGMSNMQIATSLFIGESTVKTHINNAFAKIGAQGRGDAIRYAYRQGLAEA
ncbi:response regulator transcription factor [Rhizohabitans arisaemae]|uniref:response regulator transcription factor n=1 Tax=Rhizohabitans arisaemae TaxID=2720610 RepID=UPI0024B2080D|nr:response regulator transcription factor [Rhizohabitans arisaemae]